MNTEYEMGYEDGLGDAETKLHNAAKKLEEAATKISGGKTAKVTLPKKPVNKTELRVITVGNWIMSIPYSIFSGFVCSKLWLWFVVASFSVPAVGIVAFMGITLLVGVISLGVTLSLASMDSSDEARYQRGLMRLVGFPIALSLTLLIGFIYSLFM